VQSNVKLEKFGFVQEKTQDYLIIPTPPSSRLQSKGFQGAASSLNPVTRWSVSFRKKAKGGKKNTSLL
jgi:hypothetical protein